MKKIIYLFSLFAVSLLWMGCPNTGRPTPEMTRMGAGAAPGTDAGSDFDTAGSGNAGEFGFGDGENLETRDTSFEVDGIPAYASIFFDYDRSYIRESDRSTLSDAAKLLLQNPGQKVLVEGHCDWKGTTEYNLALGDRRANSVKSYLVQLGVAPSVIETLSKGDLEALDGSDDASRKLERRGDIILIP